MLSVWKENIGLQRVKAVNTFNIKGRIWNRSPSQSSKVAKEFFFSGKHRMKRKENLLQQIVFKQFLILDFTTPWFCHLTNEYRK